LQNKKEASQKYGVAVITVSDTCYRKEKEDLSGPALAEALQLAGFEVRAKEIVPDELSTIGSVLQKYIDDASIQLILTTGGTGFSPRDVTPEATREVIERPAPGIAELLRQSGAVQTPLSWTSRGEAGVAGSTLIINLPGSTRAMTHSVETLKPLLFHVLDLLTGKHPH
jgi:molybdenum cofactor synthesis domain-containing protein